MSEEGTVFTVKFACDNCCKEWSLEFHEKVRVWRSEPISSFARSGRFIPPIPSKIYVTGNPMKPDVIECPNCKIYRDVKIVQRIPIEDRSTID